MAESKQKADVEKLYKPNNYINKFEMTSLERLPVTVIFHLVEARALQPAKSGGRPNPFAVVSLFGQKYRTEIERKTSDCLWDREFVFPNVMLTRTEFRLAELKVRVYNANTFTRNHLIGEHNFNLSKINATGNDPNDSSICDHQLFMKWVVLAHPDTPHLEGGFLRCTITVLTGDDSPPSHSAEEYQDELNAPLGASMKQMMLIPPTIKRRSFELNARIWSGRLNNPFSGKVSPQIRLSFNGVDLKSDRISRNNEPVWNQQLVIPVMTPCLSEYVRIELWDDGILSKKLIGIAEYLMWNNLVLRPVGPIWINFYGEPQIPKHRRGFWGWLGSSRPNYRRKIKDRGDTAYLGRVLAMFDVVSAVTPRKTRMALAGKDMSWQKDYVLRVDLYAGTEIPIGTYGKVQVEVTFGRFTRTTHWNKSFRTKGNKSRTWWEQFREMNKAFQPDDDEEGEAAAPVVKNDKAKNKGKPMTAKERRAAEEAKKEAEREEIERRNKEQDELDEEYMRQQDQGSRQQVIFTCDKYQRLNGDDKPNSKNKVPGCQFVEFHIPMPDTDPDDDEIRKQQFFDVVINVFVKTFWGRKRIGFLRYSPFELWTSKHLDTKPAENPPKWVRIQGIADENGHVKQQPPGFLLCSLNFGKKMDMPPRQEMQTFRKKDETRYMLQAFIFQARHLRPANENSLANPFVEVSLAGRYAKLYRTGLASGRKKRKQLTAVQVRHSSGALTRKKDKDIAPRYCYRTSCRPHDLNPVWYQTLMIEDLSLPLPPSDEFGDTKAYTDGRLGTVNQIRLTVWSDESTTSEWAKRNLAEAQAGNVNKASSSVQDSTNSKGKAGKVSGQGQSGPKEDDNLADMSDNDDEEEEVFNKGDLVQIVNREELYYEIQNKLWEVTPVPEGVRERYLKQLGGQGTFLKHDLKRSREDDVVFTIQTPYGKQSWHRGMVRKVTYEEEAEKVSTLKEQRRVLQKKKFMGRAYIDAYKALKTRQKYRQLDPYSESKYKVDYEEPLAEWVKLYDSDNDDRICVGEVYVKFVLLSKMSSNQQPDHPAALFAGSAKDGFKRTTEPFPKLRPYKAFLGMQMLNQIPLHVPLLVNPPKVDDEAALASRRVKSNKKPQQIRFLVKCSVPPTYECRKYMNTDGYKNIGKDLSELNFTNEVSCSMECHGFRDPATRAVLVNKVLEVDVPMPPPDLDRKHAPALTLSIGTTKRSKVEATLVLLLGDYLKVSTTGPPSEQNGWVDSTYEPVNQYPFYVRGGIEAYYRHKRKQFGITGTFPKTDVALVKERYNHIFKAVDPNKFIPADINALNTEYGHEINEQGWHEIEQSLLEPETNLNDKDDAGMSDKMIELQMAEIVWPTGGGEVQLEGLEEEEDEDQYEKYVPKELEAEEGYKTGLDTWPLLIGYMSKRPRSFFERLFGKMQSSMGIVGCLKGKVAVVSREVHLRRGIDYWTKSAEVVEPAQLKTWEKLELMELYGTDTNFGGLDQADGESQEQSGNPTPFWPALQYNTLQRVEVRVYVYKASDLIPANGKKKPRPYLHLSIEGQPMGVQSASYIYDIKDKPFAEQNPADFNPEFYKMYRMDAMIPHRSILRIKMLDHARGGDMIGETVIDLAQRWFNKTWRHKSGTFKLPNEYRTLYDHSDYNMPQGKLELKLEMYDKADAEKAKFMTIDKLKPKEWELRFVAWQCKGATISAPNLALTAEYQHATSQKTEAIFPSLRNQSSGTYKGAKKGKAKFNWRYVFPVKVPTRLPRIKIQLWGKKLFMDDYLAEASINLSTLFRAASAKNGCVNIKRQWIPLRHPEYLIPMSQVQVEVSLVPKAYAEEFPVGLGQDEPNNDPALPSIYPADISGNCWTNQMIILLIFAALLGIGLVAGGLYIYFNYFA